jgi:hypothetical protein
MEDEFLVEWLLGDIYEQEWLYHLDISDDNWSCGTLGVEA